MTELTPLRTVRRWNKLIKRADHAPHGTKRQRQTELKAFVIAELKREVSK